MVLHDISPRRRVCTGRTSASAVTSPAAFSGNCRLRWKLSIQEKKVLGISLAKLSFENLYRALDIVAETNPIFQPAAAEVDLDLDAQSDYTLWRLKAFVKDALEEQEKVDGGPGVNPNDNHDDKKSKKRRDSGDSSGKTNPKRKKLSSL